MVDKIYDIKNKLLEHIEKEMGERGPERLDGDMVDMVKDLAEAEKCCWEAEYYRAVTDAMESRGYMPEAMGHYYGMGYDGQDMRGGNSTRRGYRDSMGRYARRGYHEEMESVRQAMETASPEEREKMKRELRQMLDM